MSASAQPYAGAASEYARVYLRSGKRAHLLGGSGSPNSGAPALCGAESRFLEFWRGTGDQREKDRALNLPTCQRCTDRHNGVWPGWVAS